MCRQSWPSELDLGQLDMLVWGLVLGYRTAFMRGMHSVRTPVAWRACKHACYLYVLLAHPVLFLLWVCSTEFEGYDEEETVRVVMTGNQEPKSVDLTQAAMDAGPEVRTFACAAECVSERVCGRGALGSAVVAWPWSARRSSPPIIVDGHGGVACARRGFQFGCAQPSV